MRRTSADAGRRATAISAVLLAHALIAWLLLQGTAMRLVPRVASRLIFLELPPPRPPAPSSPESRAPVAAAPRSRGPRKPAPEFAAPSALPESQSAAAPPIDWAAEQHPAAERNGEKIWKELSQRCRDAEARHEHPPDCHRYVAPEPWKPEEGHVGMQGPLPWVRLGRCVVGLGFWGCAIGKPPPPDAHVFDGMRDPDRPGSVPDNGSYQPPAEGREPLH